MFTVISVIDFFIYLFIPILFNSFVASTGIGPLFVTFSLIEPFILG